MSQSDSLYDKIAKAIGNTCIWWATIEGLVHDLILHLAVCLEPTFDKKSVMDILHIALSNEDLRLKVATVKVLAHKIESVNSPQFYERVEQILNYLDNDLRLERNRFVHDGWTDEAPEIIRFSLGAKVRRTQSRKSEVVIYTEKRFSNISEIEDFVTKLEIIYDDLVTLDGHIAWLTGQKEQPPTHFQPLPQVWRSFVHRDLHDASKPSPSPQSSPA
jgi:hypothetical protein